MWRIVDFVSVYDDVGFVVYDYWAVNFPELKAWV